MGELHMMRWVAARWRHHLAEGIRRAGGVALRWLERRCELFALCGKRAYRAVVMRR